MNIRCRRGQRTFSELSLGVFHNHRCVFDRTADLDQVIHYREPDKTVILGLLRLRLGLLKSFGWIGPVFPRRIVNTELHGVLLFLICEHPRIAHVGARSCGWTLCAGWP